MRFQSTVLATIAAYTASSFAAYAVIDYFPEANDCTGRQESLEIDGDTCNSGNVILSYKFRYVDAADAGSYLDFYVDGSACVGTKGDTFHINAGEAEHDNTTDTLCHKPVPGVGSVYFFVF